MAPPALKEADASPVSPEPAAEKGAAEPAAGQRPGSRRLFGVRLQPNTWRLAGLAAAAALGLYVLNGLLQGPSVVCDRVIRADAIQTVVASGHVEAPFRVNVGSRVTGVVASVPVAEGQSVSAGTPLIVLDDREARAAVAQAEAAHAGAQARVRQMRDLTLPAAQQALLQQQATLANAQAAYDRASKLASQGYGTVAALDDATRALRIARSGAAAAELQVESSRAGGSDYALAATALEQARADLAAARSRLSYLVITAPRDGILISRNVEAGDTVQPSQVLMQLSPSGQTQLVVQIDEKNIGLIRPGETALASADAFPRQRFSSQVVYVNPGIDLERASVEVKLAVPDPPAYLRQDMTVSVDIAVARHDKAILVPARSVRELYAGQPWVMTVVNGRAQKRAIRLGIVADGQVEVLEGLTPGDFVVPATDAGIKPGQRVRIATDAGARP